MPLPFPNSNHYPARVGGLRCLAVVVGCDPDGAPKRPTRPDDYRPEGVPFTERCRWLRRVCGMIEERRANGERGIPHKAVAVARVIAELGDVCRASREYIAAKAACCVNTVEAVIAWLESKGALTWCHTTGKDRNGRRVRKANLYTLIMNFAGATAVIVRTMRTLWRERTKIVSVSKPNGCPGLHSFSTSTDPYRAMKTLQRIRKEREAFLEQQWLARHAT